MNGWWAIFRLSKYLGGTECNVEHTASHWTTKHTSILNLVLQVKWPQSAQAKSQQGQHQKKKELQLKKRKKWWRFKSFPPWCHCWKWSQMWSFVSRQQFLVSDTSSCVTNSKTILTRIAMTDKTEFENEDKMNLTRTKINSSTPGTNCHQSLGIGDGFAHVWPVLSVHVHGKGFLYRTCLCTRCQKTTKN